MLDIFLCHSQSNQNEARTLAARLERSAEAQVSLELCGTGRSETIATAWETGTSSAAIILMAGPDGVPAGHARHAWKTLLEHVEANAEPPVAIIVTGECEVPRLLQRKHFHRWSTEPREVLRTVERWVLSVRETVQDARFSPAHLPWFEGRADELEQLWDMLVDDAGTVALVNAQPGSGKTALAQEFARQASAHYREVIAIECGERSLTSIACDVARRVGVALDGTIKEVTDRVDSAAREHRLLLLFDDVRGELPLRDEPGGRSSVLITTRDPDVVPPHRSRFMRIEAAAWCTPEPPEADDERRLWCAMLACRANAFPLDLATRVAGLNRGAGAGVCRRLVARCCCDPIDHAGTRFRITAPAIEAASTAVADVEVPHLSHAAEVARVFLKWRKHPQLCADYLPEAATAFRWAWDADWPLATQIAQSAAAYLKAEARWLEAAEWYRQLLAAAEHIEDDHVRDDCAWELSWMESGQGEPHRPLSTADQLKLDW